MRHNSAIMPNEIKLGSFDETESIRLTEYFPFRQTYPSNQTHGLISSSDLVGKFRGSKAGGRALGDSVNRKVAHPRQD